MNENERYFGDILRIRTDGSYLVRLLNERVVSAQSITNYPLRVGDRVRVWFTSDDPVIIGTAYRSPTFEVYYV